MKKITCLLIIILIAAASTAGAKQKGRKYYLTQTTVTGSQALTACTKKFHMASFWEIFDTSALRYDTENGFTLDDSGSGPPSFTNQTDAFGFIRTGTLRDNSSVSADAGVANCNAWTSDTGRGSVVALNTSWGAPVSSLNISPWLAGTQTCNNPARVWCVQD
jgi:hypothetical protein